MPLELASTITTGLERKMALLVEHLLKPLLTDMQIETGPLLKAVSHLPLFFNCLGSPVFTPIKTDISGNIMKIKEVYDTDPRDREVNVWSRVAQSQSHAGTDVAEKKPILHSCLPQHL